MRNTLLGALALCGALVAASRVRPAHAAPAGDVIPLERAALDRWGKGDPGGFLETYAPEITYFDPGMPRRVDGRTAMAEYYRPITGKLEVSRYEMIGARVQRHGDVAVLTYNLRTDAVLPDGKPATFHWNSSSVYARIGGAWKVIHSHWSLTAPPGAKGAV